MTTKAEQILNEPLARPKKFVPASKDNILSKSTLFVSTIPFDAENKDLEAFFSEIGPLKSCFIVKDKVSLKSSGCGYVQFALEQDAENALKVLKKKKFDGKRTLKLAYAIRKSIVKECNYIT